MNLRSNGPSDYRAVTIVNTLALCSLIQVILVKQEKYYMKKDYRNLKSASPSMQSWLHIFDHTIKPIVSYDCENWSIINLTQKRKNQSLFDIFKDWEYEKLNTKFCKYILDVSKQSTKITVGSGLGRFPLYIDMFSHMFMYWYRLENSPSSLLVCI